VFVDVGAEGDDAFLRSGYSGRETGMRAGEDLTFRWTPAMGNATRLVLPASPHRDHVLRLRGNTLWANAVSVRVNGHDAGAVELPAGEVRVETKIPAAAIGPSPMVGLELRFAERRVPGEIAPERYPGERRVCNLSLGNVQWSTANVPAGRREPQYEIVDDAVRLTAKLFEGGATETVDVPFEPRPYLAAPGAEVLSERSIGKVPRDIALAIDGSGVLYVNGSLSEVESDAYWLPVLTRWANVDFHRFAIGEHCMAARLAAGDTEFVVCFNEDITESRTLKLAIPAHAADLPLSEAAVLSRDGRTWEPLTVTSDDRFHRASDRLQTYGVYQFAFSPVCIETPELILQPGESKTFDVQVTNLTDEPVRGHVQAASVIPTISGEPAGATLQPGETKTVAVRISTAATADWGRKTIYFDLAFAGRRAVVLRELVVEKPTEIALSHVILDAEQPRVELRVPENPYGRTAALANARLTLRGQTIKLPEAREGGVSTVALPAIGLALVAEPTLEAERLEIELGPAGSRRTIEQEVFLARKPAAYPRQQDAAAVLVVFNARSKPLERELIEVAFPEHPKPCSVRARDGTPGASQIDASGRLRFLADVPARAARTFYVCTGEAQPATDLRCNAHELGTGEGTLEVENSHLRVVLSEAAGGTVTRLQSRKTSRDYGRNSFGINYGTFSRHDPTQPRTNTVEYIQESKTRQQDSPARIELITEGPAAVVARVRWADEKVRVEQIYEFPAHQAWFRIRQRVRPIDLAGEPELVALDAPFQPHRLNKSFPNFVGVVNDQEQPHFGWRQGTWVPGYATLMRAHDFDESLSLVIPRQRGLTGIRQGFWPAERPKPGKCEIARIELLGDPAAGCEIEAYVLLHAGHQIVAKRFLADLRMPPKVDVVADPGWTPKVDEN
jgi:hypothetical protein